MILPAALEAHHRWVRLPRVNRLATALFEVAIAPRAGVSSSRAAESILDVGCGDGRVGAALGKLLGARVQGLDIKKQPDPVIDVLEYPGGRFPFADASFDWVVLADILHHEKEPELLLVEALRVGSRGVLVKDHFYFGPVSRWMLGVLDAVGNARTDVATLDARVAYFTPTSWLRLVKATGAEVTAQVWPLAVHAPAINLITRPELQFTARVQRSR